MATPVLRARRQSHGDTGAVSAHRPVCLVRGRDEHGHFDLQPRPQTDFGEVEMQRHDTTFKAYIESFYEQLGEAEKDLPKEAAAGMVY